MSTRSITLVAVVAILALAWLLWSDPGATGPAAAPAELDGAPASSPAAPAAAEGQPMAARREAAPAAAPPRPDDAIAVETTAPASVRGRVLDVRGTPLAGVPVRTGENQPVLGHSDAAGHFTISMVIAAHGTHLLALGEGFGPVRQSLVTEGNCDREHLLVAARSLDLGGVVVDTAGAPLAGAAVEVSVAGSVLRDFPLPLDMARPTRCSAVTDAQGHFALTAAPCPAGAAIVARQAGYAVGQIPVPEQPRQDLYLVLTEQAAAPEITGFVLHHDHRPAEGATVQFGADSTKSDATGAFRLPLPASPEADQPLVASLAAHGLAIAPGFGELILAEQPRPPAAVTLVLGAQREDIAGHVVDENGEGQSGWIVSLVQGTEITRNTMPPTLAEGLGGGSAKAVTTEDGSFRLSNLLTRDYELRAYHPDTLLAIFSGPVPAGTEDLAMRVAGELTHPRLRGRVVSRRGVPLAGVEVVPGLILNQTQWGSSWESGTAATTDELGFFEFADFPKAHVHLDVKGEAVVPQSFDIQPGQDVEDLAFTVAQRCHFRVEVQGPELDGLAIELRGRDGKALPIYTFSANMSSSSPRKPLEQGRAAVSAVSEDAVELLVIGKDRSEPVARQPISLSAARVNELRIVLR